MRDAQEQHAKHDDPAAEQPRGCPTERSVQAKRSDIGQSYERDQRQRKQGPGLRGIHLSEGLAGTYSEYAPRVSLV